MPRITPEQQQRYIAAAHRVQSGVKFMLEHVPQHQDYVATYGEYASPKDLRTGLDLRAADQQGLVDLLIAKGVITFDEYIESVIKAVEGEGDRFEAQATEMMGGFPVEFV